MVKGSTPIVHVQTVVNLVVSLGALYVQHYHNGKMKSIWWLAWGFYHVYINTTIVRF